MKEFEVKIIEILERTVTVAAKNLQEAEEQAELEWHQGKHILGADDFSGSDFTAVKETTRTIDGLLIEPLQPPTRVTIEHDLAHLQEMVDGYIECVRPFDVTVIIGSNRKNSKYKGFR
ncbi:MAG: DpnD/PcfM family protein [Eubacteriales bacterium]